MQPLDTCDVLELCVILIIRGSLAIRRGQYRCPVTVQQEQQGIFRCRAGVGGQGSHEAMESPEALMCPLEKGVRGIESSGSGYLRYVEDAKAARSVRVWDRVPMKDIGRGIKISGLCR